MSNESKRSSVGVAALFLGAALVTASEAPAQTILANNDGVIRSSLCVGFDCPNSINFGFDTIRLMENNLRIMFIDTSTAGGFPSGDWQLVANQSTSGGQNYFAIRSCGTADAGGASECGTRRFTVETGTVADPIYVHSTGRVGFRTASPVLDLHVRTGNTPGLRLDQDGSSGFPARTWDIAGNEANFFVRDVTGGSLLPFRIRPGAPTSSIDIAASGNVGMGTGSPNDALHLRRASGAVGIRLSSGSQPNDIRLNFNTVNDEFRINWDGVAGVPFRLNEQGDVIITGDLTTGGAGTCAPPNPPCDRVFDADYEIPSIGEHAKMMWANNYLPAIGPTAENHPINVTQKLTRMLNELEKAHIYIVHLHARILNLEAARKHSLSE